MTFGQQRKLILPPSVHLIISHRLRKSAGNLFENLSSPARHGLLFGRREWLDTQCWNTPVSSAVAVISPCCIYIPLTGDRASARGLCLILNNNAERRNFFHRLMNQTCRCRRFFRKSATVKAASSKTLIQVTRNSSISNAYNRHQNHEPDGFTLTSHHADSYTVCVKGWEDGP